MLKHWVLAWRNSTVDLPPSRNWRDCSWALAWAQLCHQATCPSSQTWSWWCGCRTGDAILQSKNVRQGLIQRREDSQANHMLSTALGGVWKVPPKLTLQSKKLLFLPEQRRQTKVPKVIEAHLGVLLGQSAQIWLSGRLSTFSRSAICFFIAVSFASTILSDSVFVSQGISTVKNYNLN